MKAKGLVPSNAIFAGHSLGEYAALASVANLFSIENLVELDFIRGITMQNAVSRDENGHSSFGMVAVNPQRIKNSFKLKDLQEIVNEISKQSNKLLQIVNYNVENWQYVVTGYNSNLEVLRIVLDKLKESTTKINIAELVSNILKQFSEEKYYELKKGAASIPLSGIDVPFHSSI